jgi:hypothetical protein
MAHGSSLLRISRYRGCARMDRHLQNINGRWHKRLNGVRARMSLSQYDLSENELSSSYDEFEPVWFERKWAEPWSKRTPRPRKWTILDDECQNQASMVLIFNSPSRVKHLPHSACTLKLSSRNNVLTKRRLCNYHLNRFFVFMLLVVSFIVTYRNDRILNFDIKCVMPSCWYDALSCGSSLGYLTSPNQSPEIVFRYRRNILPLAFVVRAPDVNVPWRSANHTKTYLQSLPHTNSFSSRAQCDSDNQKMMLRSPTNCARDYNGNQLWIEFIINYWNCKEYVYYRSHRC